MFLARERQLGRDDLVLPIYFIDCEELEDRATRDGDHLAQAIAKHQYVDWRKLRHAHPKAVRKRVDELAGSIRKALKRSATRTSPS
jgi:F-box protein 11